MTVRAQTLDVIFAIIDFKKIAQVNGAQINTTFNREIRGEISLNISKTNLTFSGELFDFRPVCEYDYQRRNQMVAFALTVHCLDGSAIHA